jgi:NDP-sugar pyrophosphorylase family protein
MSEPVFDPAALTAVILAGGQGTRLQAVLPGQQKVVAAVGPQPFVAHLLDQLGAAGVRRAVLCTGYQAEQVQQRLGSAYGAITLRYSVETEPLGTAGALRLALPLVTGATALVLNGDSYCDFDLAAFWHAHAASGACGTLLLAHLDDTHRYGQVDLAADGAVARFVEKGARGGPGWVSAGVYLLGRAILESIPPARAVSIEREVFPAWVGRGLHGWPGGGRFIDIGTPATLAESQAFFTRDAPQPGGAR